MLEKCARLHLILLVLLALSLTACGGGDSGGGDGGGGGSSSGGCFDSRICTINQYGNPQGCITYHYCPGSTSVPTVDDNRFSCKLECPSIHGFKDLFCLKECDSLYADTIAPTTSASPVSGIYDSTQVISFKRTNNDGFCNGGGRTYYTTDGSIPDTNSPQTPDFFLQATQGFTSGPIIFQDATLHFFSIDCAGNQEEIVKEEIYFINDTTAPVITLRGPESITLEVGDTYVEQGAIVTDDDPSLTVILTGTTDTSTPGNYTITYSATDRAGNAGAITRSVTVILETTAPVITLRGPESITLVVGDIYVEQGATATDNLDPSVIVTLTGMVDTSIPGSYIITYNATDMAGNAANAVIRSVNVIPPAGAPVITLTGSALLTLPVGDNYVEQGATATDDVDPTVNVVITGMVDTSTLGSYTITYNATDTDGNLALAVTRAVIVTDVIVVLTQPLNDTGILTGGNYPTGNNLSCIGETVAEQDCSTGRDALNSAGSLPKTGAGHGGFDFTKLDAVGDALTVDATGWSCVRDNHTGLVWEVKDTILNSIHNQTNNYQWGGKTSLLNGDFGIRHNDWDTLIDESNDGSGLCGFTDWRVPSLEQLRSIVNYSKDSPAVDTNYFPVTGCCVYWTASPYLPDNSLAAMVNFGQQGTDRTAERTKSYHVRLVRGGQ